MEERVWLESVLRPSNGSVPADLRIGGWQGPVEPGSRLDGGATVRRARRVKDYCETDWISVTSGMNRAMTMPPTIVPRTTTMMGSRVLTRPATAVSTSSS